MWAILFIPAGEYLYKVVDPSYSDVLFSKKEVEKYRCDTTLIQIATFNTKKEASKYFTKTYWDKHSVITASFIEYDNVEYSFLDNAAVFEIVNLTGELNDPS